MHAGLAHSASERPQRRTGHATLEAECERLRDALDFKRSHPPSAVMAQVIGKQSSPVSSTITLNKGEDHGIRKDILPKKAFGCFRAPPVSSGECHAKCLAQYGG